MTKNNQKVLINTEFSYICNGCTEKCIFTDDDMVECPITHNYVDNYLELVRNVI